MAQNYDIEYTGGGMFRVMIGANGYQQKAENRLPVKSAKHTPQKDASTDTIH